ncbi:spore germination protein [Cohnella sp. GCM10027633]|uniref:spore germination protein n=1 Tax=unclassified Cohnella TaxID=2636738 RepID=UPI003627AD4F
MSAFDRRLERNEAYLRDKFDRCSDVVFRSVTLRDDTALLLVYLDGMTRLQGVEDHLLHPLIMQDLAPGTDRVRTMTDWFRRERFPLANVAVADSLDDVMKQVLTGGMGILLDGENAAIIAQVQGYETRGIQEPNKEATLRGSKEGFVEHLRTNTSMIRRRIVHPSLKMESFTIGEYTRTEVVVAYMEGVAEPRVLEEVRAKLNRIELDGVLDTAYLEEWLEGNALSIFSQIHNTERPDIAAAGLIEGKVAILANGTPFVLILPITFWSGLQSADDYFERFVYVVLLRLIRYAMTFISFALPAVYVSLTTFHPEMVPSYLMIGIATARESSPFPTMIEVFLMTFIFDGLQEAGVHLPNQLGPVVSIIGALVIGQAAVEAGIISTPIIIVISLTGVAAYTIPKYSAALPFRIIRYMMLFASGFLGFVGFAFGLIFLLIHLVMLESFGTPFLSPVAPLDRRRIKDWIVRYPFRAKGGPRKKGLRS